MLASDARQSNFSGMDLYTALVALTTAMLLLVAATQVQAQTFTILHNFSGPDGEAPWAGVTLDRAGRIYGTTFDGGTVNQGVIYRLSPSPGGWTETVLYSFNGSEGGSVMSRVVFGPDSVLYGTTPNYGPHNAGTVFKLTPPPTACEAVMCPWTKTVLYAFTAGSDGGYPQGDLLFDAAGNIYGVAAGGGTQGYGVVYKLTRSGGTWTESVLYSFTAGADGCEPLSGPVFDSAGNIYGVTFGDECSQWGTVYKLTPSQSGWSETTLYTITDQGAGNATGLTIDAHGNLFGLTGEFGTGIAYELIPGNGNWNFSLLNTLPQGYQGPFDAPTLDVQGNLYGTSCCVPEPQIDGVVFKLTPTGVGWSYTNLHIFNGEPDGDTPTGSVTVDSNGNLYGTTLGGGRWGGGTVWEITP
jgi:uncharacterized repeat protein (TIGR03803 family)